MGSGSRCKKNIERRGRAVRIHGTKRFFEEKCRRGHSDAIGIKPVEPGYGKTVDVKNAWHTARIINLKN